MKISAIICECNPPHAGHALLMQKAKNESDLLIMLCSGCFTQRGVPSLFGPYDKAEMLLKMGADLVLELPFPFSCASADIFASAGVSILENIGATDLYFGSENGDLAFLTECANTVKTDVFQQTFREKLAEHKGTRLAFEEALASFGKASFGSNDILAIAYISHLKTLTPHTIKREGASYLSKELTALPSATALREKANANGLADIILHLPPEIQDLAQKLCQEKSYCLEDGLIALAHKIFLFADAYDVQNDAELGGGLGNRLVTLAKEIPNPKEFLQKAVTKEYTLARIRRGMLYHLIGITEKDLKKSPSYVRLLGANQKGLDYLSDIRYTHFFPIVTKQKDIPPKTTREKRIEEISKKLYSILCEKEGDYSIVKKPPIIQKG